MVLRGRYAKVRVQCRMVAGMVMVQPHRAHAHAHRAHLVQVREV